MSLTHFIWLIRWKWDGCCQPSVLVVKEERKMQHKNYLRVTVLNGWSHGLYCEWFFALSSLTSLCLCTYLLSWTARYSKLCNCLTWHQHFESPERKCRWGKTRRIGQDTPKRLVQQMLTKSWSSAWCVAALRAWITCTSHPNKVASCNTHNTKCLKIVVHK